jgi:predicted DsbA family dithiol-disulfide isomerase
VNADRLPVRVHYDFASTLCYVAHRVMVRMADELERLSLDLVWSPLDLSQLLPRRRSEAIPEPIRRNAARVARELSVPVRVPARWIDSRGLLAQALVAERHGHGTSYREQVWTSLYEGGRPPRPECDDLELRRARGELEVRTAQAAEELVTGVPTFMLGSWPFGGIQEEATMRAVVERFASRARRRWLV